LSDIIKKLVLLTLTALLTLAAGEVVLRAIGYGVITPRMNFGANTRLGLDQGVFEADPDLFWKIPPHPADAAMRAVQPDRAVPPKGRAPRIVVIGDSCSRISQAVPPYSVLLQDTLAARTVEVWNAAVPGYTSWQGRVWLDRQLLSLEPEVAVIYFGWNDHWRSTGVTDAAYAQRQRKSSLRLALLLRRTPAVKPLRVSPDEYRANLAYMVAALHARGARVFLIAAPSRLTGEARQHLVQTGYLTPDDNAIELHRQYLLGLKEVADTSPATMINVSSLFSGLGDQSELMMRDGIHLTDRGHQVLAAVLAEACGPVLAGAAPVTVDEAALARRAAAAYAGTGATPTPAEAP
jgi:lysophospholipase L1-like esterase